MNQTILDQLKHDSSALAFIASRDNVQQRNALALAIQWGDRAVATHARNAIAMNEETIITAANFIINNTRHPLYLAEFPDFDATDEAEELIALGFEDYSWHNDTCPRFHVAGWQVFMDYRSSDLSEWGDEPNRKRFSLYPVNEEGELLSDTSHDFETLAEMVAFWKSQP